MKSIREILQGPSGKVAAVGLFLVGALGLFLSVRNGGGPSGVDFSRRRTFVDAENGKSFQLTLSIGDTVPVKSPFTGKMTGKEAELCYWTAEGTPKATPDSVLLNSARIPPLPEPTFCPVCHRLVIGHNPPARAGDTAPPTQSEYVSH